MGEYSIDDFTVPNTAPETEPRYAGAPKQVKPSYALDPGLPANVDAERTILGAILLENTAYYEVLEAGLDESVFSLDSHRRIFMVMRNLADESRTQDLVTLAHELARLKVIESIGGVAYLASLTEGLPRRPVIGEYIRIIKDKALLRQIMLISSAAIARAADQSETAVEILNATQEQILETAAQGVSHAGKTAFEWSREYVHEFEMEADSVDDGLAGVSLGLPALNETTRGLVEGELAIVAGRPGSGKTEWAIQCMLENARAGKRVYFFSMEMTAKQIMRRAWRHMAQIPVWAMRDPRKLGTLYRDRIKLAQEEFADLPVMIDDTHELTSSMYTSRAILAAKRWKADLMELDYAQLMIINKGTLLEKAMKQAHTLRHVARDYCRTIALAQLRRAPPMDMNKFPDKEDLLGSSSFEQAAQIILLIHRTKEDKEYTGEDWLFLDKMREGDVKRFPIAGSNYGAFFDRIPEVKQSKGKVNAITSWHEKD